MHTKHVYKINPKLHLTNYNHLYQPTPPYQPQPSILTNHRQLHTMITTNKLSGPAVTTTAVEVADEFMNSPQNCDGSTITSGGTWYDEDGSWKLQDI